MRQRSKANGQRGWKWQPGGGLSGDEMASLPQLEIVCAVGAGYEAVELAHAEFLGSRAACVGRDCQRVDS